MTKRNLYMGGGAVALLIALIALPSRSLNSQEPADAKIARMEERLADAQARLAERLASGQERLAQRVEQRALQASVRAAVAHVSSSVLHPGRFGP